jgi:hypothetical protein
MAACLREHTLGGLLLSTQACCWVVEPLPPEMLPTHTHRPVPYAMPCRHIRTTPPTAAP